MPRSLPCAILLLLVAVACSTAEEPAEPEERLPLPSAASIGARELKLGEKLALDDLGPLIVTAEGGLRRIANWQTLSEGERATALRRLAKRNRERLATVEEQQQLLTQQQQQAGEQQQAEQAAEQQQEQRPEL